MGPRLAERTVSVIGSGTDEHDNLARQVGQLLATLGVNLLTGGGQGVMKAVSRAFTEAPRTTGICIGIIPCASITDRVRPKQGYPNEFVELAIYTHLPYSGELGKHDLSRNHINVLSCSAIIALPGAAGTASEVSLALDYGKPTIAFAPHPDAISNWPSSIPKANSIEDLEQFLRSHL
jgi:uncharacterized protein (TIGR00725 family)